MRQSSINNLIVVLIFVIIGLGASLILAAKDQAEKPAKMVVIMGPGQLPEQ
jgi:hypothetical protein